MTGEEYDNPICIQMVDDMAEPCEEVLIGKAAVNPFFFPPPVHKQGFIAVHKSAGIVCVEQIENGGRNYFEN